MSSIRRASRTKLTAALGLTCAAALTLSACSSTDSASIESAPASPVDGPITIVASTNVWGSVAEAVAGDLATVTSLISDPSADPHSYEASPADAAAVAEASLVVYNGGGYDQFIEDILGSEGKDVPSVDAFTLLDESHDHDSEPASGEATPEAEATDGDGHSHGEVNEHVWYHAEVAAHTAEEIADKLGQLDPDNAAQYTANAETFHEQVHGITDVTAKIAADHPNAPVAQTEPIAHYLIEESELDDRTPEDFKNSIEEGNDPSPASIAATRDLFTSKSVRALVYNIQTEDAVTQDIRSTSEAAGIPVVEVTETLPAGMTYIEWQTKAATDLQAALATAP
ncbi:ABC transporter permease [Rhodococcus sp. 05-340-1]|uniref:metal ABC transporter solute-binding protein, Zn/Mn family n=1 Tax=unclassified Rhodococcus (in: high G+C Gram-positive bacteria) TaxID=192944 RepID=UPI000B9BA531|nr:MULTISPECIES: zinc ABC transporter substrate-binding protein [unclassified Rhodococcus (in: high G+C Gram-positive bacteria)]OZD70592.1 ABC transporter permease [Rhodococcus sp. 05-340-1]OZD72364.1 ABC transporter permease [Rhodococcus sp. 05-340-2]